MTRELVLAALDGRYLTAHHEAGHAVAVLMRGGELTSVTIDPAAVPESARPALGYTEPARPP